MMAHGTTSICPTISAAPFEVMEKSVIEVKKAMEDGNLKSNYGAVKYDKEDTRGKRGRVLTSTLPDEKDMVK